MTGTTNPAPIDLEGFERLVYARDYEKASGELLKIIGAIKSGSGFSWYGATPSVDMLFTRLAAAISSLMADPNYMMSYDGFVRLVVEHPTFHSIFRCSQFKTADHVLNLVGVRDPAAPQNVNFSGLRDVPKLLLCWSLESDIDLPFEKMAESVPEYVQAALLGILGIGGVHTDKAYQRKIELSRKRQLLEAVPMNEVSMLAVGDVYMHCSYTDAPDRHEVKKSLNKLLRQLVETKMVEVGKPVRESDGILEAKERPTVCIPIEWFGSHHAMYRCYAPSIRQLRTKFRVVGICRPHEVDDAAKQEFDKCVVLPQEGVSIAQMVETIAEEKPDIMFYPSIGMAAWWVALSNFRLAPLQVMCPGHPATTHSPCIDYIVSDGDLFGDERLYSERVVKLPVGGARYIKRSDFDRKALPEKRGGLSVRIAVPAMVMKLTPPFFRALQRIQEESSQLIEWHFFPNVVAAYHHLVEKDITQWLKNVVVHNRDHYNPYMDKLAQCDFMCSTFPFGGTNSTIDAFLAGVPVICWEGNQIHERSDASMIRRIGLPERLITHTYDEYVNAALDLIVEPSRRARLQQQLKETDVEAEFYGDGPPHVRGAFVDAFQRIYQEKLDEQKRAISEVAG